MLSIVAPRFLAVLVGAALVPAAGFAVPSTPARFGSCPRAALAITRSDLPAAQRAVRRFLPRRYRDTDLRGVKTRAALAPKTVRGGYAKLKCGERVWRRTAVVFVSIPSLLPSQSLSTPVFYVSWTRAGWTVWYQIH
jgi:hypothetical protein